MISASIGLRQPGISTSIRSRTRSFRSCAMVQQLQSLITTDRHGDAVIDLGNHNSVIFANTAAAQMQPAIRAGHILLH